MSGVKKGTKRTRPPRSAKADAKRVGMVLRRRLVMQLRIGGASFDTIARQLSKPDDAGKIHAPTSYDRAGAYKDFQTAVKELVDETREEVLKTELERLDAMHKKLWQKVQGRGDKDAIDTVLALMKMRASYLGLYAPTKTHHSGSVSVTDVTALSDEQLRARIDELKRSGK